MKMNFKKWFVAILFSSTSFIACDDFFDVQTDDLLQAEDNNKERETIYAGLLGLSDLFRSAVEHNVIQAELLGDLMTPTSNAPESAWDVFRYSGTNGNEFASPEPYYRLITNTNEYLHGLVAYKKAFPDALSSNIYRGLVSNALNYRIWAYLQLGKLYGGAYYHSYSFVDDNGTVPTNWMSFNELIPELIFAIKTGVDGVNGFVNFDWKIIVAPADDDFDQTWNKVAVDGNVMLTELYLWNKDYTNTVITGLNFLTMQKANYKLDVFERNDNGAYQWGAIFAANSTFSGDLLKEVITGVAFNYDKHQTSKLQYYFSDQAPNVNYFEATMSAYFRYRSMMVENEDAEVGEDSLVAGWDGARQYSTLMGKEIVKYSRKALGESKEPYRHDAPIYVYRAPEVWLMIAEALSGLDESGRSNLNISAGDLMINEGLKPSWVNSAYRPPFNLGIYSSVLNVYPGIRGRIPMKGSYVRHYIDPAVYPDSTEDLRTIRYKREKLVLDSLIGEETALEFAYEGKRWFTLMRIARNNDNPAFLAEQMSKKFVNTGDQEVFKRWLMEPKNWFIKWDQSDLLEK